MDRCGQTNPHHLLHVSMLPQLHLHLHAHNIKGAFYNYDSLELAPICFLNSVTVLLSMPAITQQRCTTSGGRRANCTFDVVVLADKRTRESLWAVQSCELITALTAARPDEKLRGTPAKKPLKCNESIRLIFGGGSVVQTPLFVLISRSHIIQLLCCYLASQVYHSHVSCKLN